MPPSEAKQDQLFDSLRQYNGLINKIYVASLKEIKENDFNLNIPRYVDTFEEEEVILLSDMQEIDADIKEISDNIIDMLENLC